MSTHPATGDSRAPRVLLVDDQTATREAAALLLDTFPEIELVGTANDGMEALIRVEELRPDVVLMDLHMPRMDGVEATTRIRADYPRTRILVFTTYATDDLLVPALLAGAQAHLTRDVGGEKIVKAILAVHDGQLVIL